MKLFKRLEKNRLFFALITLLIDIFFCSLLKQGYVQFTGIHMIYTFMSPVSFMHKICAAVGAITFGFITQGNLGKQIALSYIIYQGANFFLARIVSTVYAHRLISILLLLKFFLLGSLKMVIMNMTITSWLIGKMVLNFIILCAIFI